MIFQHCSIIGLGLLGGSLALDLRRQYPEMVITGIARQQATLAQAATMRIDDMPVFTHLSCELTATRGADLVVLCTPVQTILTQLVEMAPLLPAGAVVTDVGSTKRAVMNAAATVLPAGVSFIGGHPMAGSDRAGIAHAREGLYRGAIWALCIPAAAEKAAEGLVGLVEGVGAHPLMLDADLHDQLVALTSHLPHITSAALASYVLGNPHGDALLPFIVGGFRDTTRIAAGNPAMWRDIMLTNRDNILEALHGLIADLGQWRDAIGAGDAPHLEALLTMAHNQRERLNS